MNSETELVNLAKERFTNLTAAEEKLFMAVAKGETANFSASSEKENDPSCAYKWSSERVLDGGRLSWLITDATASKLVTHRGVSVMGAIVHGALNLEWANITFPLSLIH